MLQPYHGAGAGGCRAVGVSCIPSIHLGNPGRLAQCGCIHYSIFPRKKLSPLTVVGLVHPEAGTVEVFGQNHRRHALAVKASLGYVPEVNQDPAAGEKAAELLTYPARREDQVTAVTDSFTPQLVTMLKPLVMGTVQVQAMSLDEILMTLVRGEI